MRKVILRTLVESKFRNRTPDEDSFKLGSVKGPYLNKPQVKKTKIKRKGEKEGVKK